MLKWIHRYGQIQQQDKTTTKPLSESDMKQRLCALKVKFEGRDWIDGKLICWRNHAIGDVCHLSAYARYRRSTSLTLSIHKKCLFNGCSIKLKRNMTSFGPINLQFNYCISWLTSFGSVFLFSSIDYDSKASNIDWQVRYLIFDQSILSRMSILAGTISQVMFTHSNGRRSFTRLRERTPSEWIRCNSFLCDVK